MKVLIIILIIIILLKLLKDYMYKNNNNIDNCIDNKFKGKIKNSPLTENEKYFYNKLKEITDKYNLVIFPKLRLADIFETNNISDFNRIKAKHIDFTICNKDLNFLIFIELDDKTHEYKKNKINDEKKNFIFDSLNTNLVRIKNNNLNEKLVEIEKQISTLL